MWVGAALTQTLPGNSGQAFVIPPITLPICQQSLTSYPNVTIVTETFPDVTFRKKCNGCQFLLTRNCNEMLRESASKFGHETEFRKDCFHNSIFYELKLKFFLFQIKLNAVNPRRGVLGEGHACGFGNLNISITKFVCRIAKLTQICLHRVRFKNHDLLQVQVLFYTR